MKNLFFICFLVIATTHHTCGFVSVPTEVSSSFFSGEELTNFYSKYSDVPPPTSVEWFDQTVDHFNYQSNATFKQRMFVYDKFWNPEADDKAIFFYTGNEGPLEMFYYNTGLMFDWAPEFNALIVFAEHRNYGLSMCNGNSSLNRPDIGVLSVEQAIADYAIIVDYLRTKYNAPDVPAAAFGGSYGGMLSAWFRLKYPNVIDAALAASAPVVMVGTEPHVAKPEFFQTITEDYRQANSQCPDLFRSAFAQVLSPSTTLAQISQAFQLCKPLTQQSELEHLVLWAVNSFANMAMADYPYAASFLGRLPAWPVNYTCDMMVNASSSGTSSLLTALGDVVALYYNGSSPTPLTCLDQYAEFFECADQTGCGTGPSGIAWNYQACTQFIYFPSTDNITDMFPPHDWNIDKLTAYCQKTFGITPRPDWMGTHFGSGQFLGASNIIFSNGELDPWKGGGVQQSLSDSLIAISISEGAHHLDLRSATSQDPDSVIAARKEENYYIHTWLKQAQRERRARLSR